MSSSSVRLLLSATAVVIGLGLAQQDDKMKHRFEENTVNTVTTIGAWLFMTYAVTCSAYELLCK